MLLVTEYGSSTQGHVTTESFSDMGWSIQVEEVVYRELIERLVGKLTRVYEGSGD